MLNTKELQNKLKDMNLRAVSKSSNVSYDVVWRIANNKATNPSFKTISKLNDYFKGENNEA